MKKFHVPNSIQNSKRSKVSPPSAPPTRDQSRKNGDVTWSAQMEIKMYSVSDQSNVKTREVYQSGSQAKLRMPTLYATTKTSATDSRHSTMFPTNFLPGPSHDQIQDKSNTTLLATTGLTRTTEKCSKWLHSQPELLHALATTTNQVTFDANGAKSRSQLSDASEPTDQKVNMTISTMKICTNMITRWLITCDSSYDSSILFTRCHITQRDSDCFVYIGTDSKTGPFTFSVHLNWRLIFLASDWLTNQSRMARFWLARAWLHINPGISLAFMGFELERKSPRIKMTHTDDVIMTSSNVFISNCPVFELKVDSSPTNMNLTRWLIRWLVNHDDSSITRWLIN